METINIIENKIEVIKQDYTLYDKEVLHACFITGATYQVPCANLISKGVEVQFTVVKNTHKSVTIEVVEKYNGTINTSKAVKRLNAGGVGFWKTIQGVEYATVETFNANKLTRWVKGYINPFGCELATKELTVDGQDVSTVEKAEPVQEVEPLTPCDCFKCPLGKKCQHYQAYRRHPHDIGGLGLCHILTGTLQEKLREIEKTEPVENAEPVEKAEPVQEVEPLTPCDCFKCPLGKKCQHYQAYRRHPHDIGGLGLCHILTGTLQEKLREIEKTEPVENAEPVEKVEPVENTKPVQEVENAEPVPVEEIPKSTLIDYVMKNFDLTERQTHDINRFYPDFIDKKEFSYIIDFLNDIYGFVSYAINLINANSRYGTLDMYCRSDIVELIFNYSVATKELYEDGTNAIFILMRDCLSSNSRYISKCDNTLYIENDVLIEKEFLKISYDKRNDILDLIEHCEHFTTKRELLSIVSNKFNISKDIVIELYNKYMNNLYLDEDIEPVEETPTVEPVEETELICNYSKCPETLYDCFKCPLGKKCESYEFRVGSLVCMLHDCDSPMSSSYVIERFKEMGVTTKDIIQLYDMYLSGVYIKPDENVIQYMNKDIERLKSLELDINTSYPELECFENIEEVEENTIFKVGCLYTGNDKSLYLVTKRGLNTIDVMSISKGFQQYDIPIVTDIYDNEYVTISFSNRISVISSINLKYTEKNFKRTLYDFVNNNFYGNDVYGKYDEKDVKRVLNMLYGKIID